MFQRVRRLTQAWRSWKASVSEKRPWLGKGIHWTESVVNAVVIALILRQFVVQSSLVFSGSMIPTLRSATPTTFGDRLIVNKLVYHFNAPNRGDIVLFDSPFKDGKQYVKRLIGLPGETVEMRRGMVYINDQLLVISGVTIRRDYTTLAKQTIPSDHYFMLGDNRSNSADSRVWGFVPKEDLIGEALFIYWPLDRIRWVK
jgi:signal peptidase I